MFAWIVCGLVGIGLLLGLHVESLSADTSDGVDDLLPMTWSPEGDKIAIGSEKGMIRVWSSTTNALLAELNGHSAEVTALAWSPDNIHLVSGGHDSTVRIWDTTTSQNEATFDEPLSGVTVVSWSPDGCQIIAVAEDGELGFFVWDVATRRLIVNQTIRYCWN